eukprot:scaffold34819_cov147-Isochrysis_galbana.AAC.3
MRPTNPLLQCHLLVGALAPLAHQRQCALPCNVRRMPKAESRNSFASCIMPPRPCIYDKLVPLRRYLRGHYYIYDSRLVMVGEERACTRVPFSVLSHTCYVHKPNLKTLYLRARCARKLTLRVRAYS